MTTPFAVDAERAGVPLPSTSSDPSANRPLPVRFRGSPFGVDWDDRDAASHDDDCIESGGCKYERKRLSRCSPGVFGFGREYSIFESAPRGGARNRNNYFGGDNNGYEEYPNDSDDDGANDDEDVEDEDDFLTRMERYRERRKSVSSVSRGYNSNSSNNNDGYSLSRGGRPPLVPGSQTQRNRRKQQRAPKILRDAQNWWKSFIDPKIQSVPKIVCRMEPTTTLKLRKTFRPLKTIVRLGADYNTQQGIWQFKSSWEDAIIGGKLTLSGNKELQMTKSWSLSVGGVEDLVTRLRFRATINLQTFQAYARVGFRTERLTPIDVVEGFTILKRLPLDGSSGNLKLEVKANVALPEPEIEYSTEAQRSLIGMGNIEVSIDEMNLLLDY
eukprot:CAMPEP_0201123180 /NCGR_PEP_ID=MMETSP0850-20130426/6620_1 /ASSEMBLY_ACC=CAM_ASM_000622 /TAXON_ID=183588 /ORGANISM="Pseudo-nitzschia fraudulenta, Strain WWA7" /LENGTH=384 /DNA_ID=CAMNT_0047390029 /DNA_START=147 /DNA_END=1301 /DNA_ORIENTATION=-